MTSPAIRSDRLWCVLTGLVLGALVLLAITTAHWEVLFASPCVLVLTTCGRRYAGLHWLWADRRYDNRAPELFGRQLMTRMPRRRLRDVDLRDITTPSWAIDITTVDLASG
jgi:hypothetical protein